ncbi:MAG TPA: MBL fold metallo-hydrolase, partial [Anaerolineae bacterium]|nr:MBL fold metallo-hydrolase [Anaerolineae bacterium]
MTSAAFQQLTPSLWVTQSPLFATNSGIFMEARQACLIDPGITPEEIRGIARFVLEQGATVQALILTHSHWDHLLGPEHFPGAKIITQLEYKNSVAQRGEAILQQVSRWETQANILRSQPFTLPRPTLAFESRLYLMGGDHTLQLLPAPGHAADQLVIYEATTGMLWAADMLSDVEIPFVSHSLSAYEETLARLATLDVQVLIPGHGTPTTIPAEIQARFDADRSYLKALRERVRAAIADGKTLAETVALCADIPFHHPE